MSDTALLIAGLYLCMGCVVVLVKLYGWDMLRRLTWRDTFSLLLVIVLWPVLVVF